MLLRFGKLELRMVLATTVLLALSAVSSVSAEGPPKAVDLSELPYVPTVEKFLQAIEDRDIGTAVETLGWPEEAAAKMTKSLGELVSIGPHDGHEIVAVRRISPRLHQVFGIIHYAQKPVLFTLLLRQFKGEWHIRSVHFSDDLKPLDELAPLERVAETKKSKVAVQLH